MVTGHFVSLAVLAASAVGQLQTVDTGRGITVGFAIPNVDEPPFDVAVSISASADVGWAGVGWGSGGSRAPLSVVRPDGESVVATAQWIEYEYHPTGFDRHGLLTCLLAGALLFCNNTRILPSTCFLILKQEGTDGWRPSCARRAASGKAGA